MTATTADGIDEGAATGGGAVPLRPDRGLAPVQRIDARPTASPAGRSSSHTASARAARARGRGELPA